MDLEVFKQLGVAVLLGALIGVERERRYQLFDYENVFGGIRTFSLIGLMGAMSYVFAEFSSGLFLVLTAGFLSLMVMSYFLTSRKSKRSGATTEMAAILVYMVGIMCAMERYVVATAIALSVLLILHFKDPLHKWAKQMQNREIVSTIEFGIIAFVILPLLPNAEYGPFGFFNPYVIWLMVVFISGLSFLSYFAIKVIGAKRGITLAGFLGGLVSSTAVTLGFSAESKKNRTISIPYIVAVVVASSAMFFRILIEVAVVNQELLGMILVPMVVMGLVGLMASLFFLGKQEKKKSAKVMRKGVLKDVPSPFSLVPALKFGAFFAAILFLSKFALAMMGDKGFYLTAVFSGVVDVDAITLSASSLAQSDIGEDVAVMAITIAAMVNTFAKGVMFAVFGRKDVAVKIAQVFLLMLLAGGIALIFV